MSADVNVFKVATARSTELRASAGERTVDRVGDVFFDGCHAGDLVGAAIRDPD